MAVPVRGLAGLATVMAIGAVALLIAIASNPPTSPTAPSVLAANGDPMTLEALQGPAPLAQSGSWEGRPVLVLKLSGDVAGPSLQVPGAPSFTIVIFEARSTHLGCLVEPVEDPNLGWVLRDICHFGAWDPYAGAAVLQQPAPKPLPQLAPSLLSTPDGRIVLTATGPT